jgi:hypothetical protein
VSVAGVGEALTVVDDRLTDGETGFDAPDAGVVVLVAFPPVGSDVVGVVVLLGVVGVVVVVPPVAGAIEKGVENTFGAVKSF